MSQVWKISTRKEASVKNRMQFLVFMGKYLSVVLFEDIVLKSVQEDLFVFCLLLGAGSEESVASSAGTS